MIYISLIVYIIAIWAVGKTVLNKKKKIVKIKKWILKTIICLILFV